MNSKTFCQKLPKVECHAHLSGSIPLEVLKELHKDAKERQPNLGPCPSPSEYTDLRSFFALFGDHIYHILDTPKAITRATSAVLKSFRDEGCIYLELRTTPRKFPRGSDTFEEYLDAVFDAIDRNDQSSMMVQLILTVNWDFEPDKVREIVELATTARNAGRCVVGIDIAGDPRKSILRTESFTRELIQAKLNGLKLTIHFAEIVEQKPFLEKQLADLTPDRLGHAVFLTPEVQADIVRLKRPIEICLTSNLKVGSIASLEEHHFRWAVENQVPVLISTDDTLVFGTTLSEEYEWALGLLNHDRQKLLSVLKQSITCTFCSSEDQQNLIQKVDQFSTM
ncbi:hypothetical protein PTTG_06613 [Puccinia triticina 1-1 BBBD Race 1]|uniref:A_deaminase domain-containing protein n=2 Tax=Puccinia triticina TaxID=208348 RepID=A0A180GBI6_PUCT1|nr:uncharacterized protein PtA15_15A287 [Puccinia triticina]OAV90045.1 hypothetical protein PTTG_06613 [Puccinia triticina 1-1 BBBD Race 1]WAQ91894.1 hypothetical protein PtA15_15A287 [Puccinia triticina]